MRHALAATTLFCAILIASIASDARAQQFQFDPAQIQGAVQGMLMQSMFNITDTNQDGNVSRQEAIDTAAKRFDEADKNHDGIMTKDEMQQAAKKQTQMNQRRAAPVAPVIQKNLAPVYGQ